MSSKLQLWKVIHLIIVEAKKDVQFEDTIKLYAEAK